MMLVNYLTLKIKTISKFSDSDLKFQKFSEFFLHLLTFVAGKEKVREKSLKTLVLTGNFFLMRLPSERGALLKRFLLFSMRTKNELRNKQFFEKGVLKMLLVVLEFVGRL